MIKINNTLGQTVKIIHVNTDSFGINKIEVDLSVLSSGVYFVQLQSKDNSITKKVIKE